MKPRPSLLSLLVMVTLVVAACGRAASTPDAATKIEDSGAVMVGDSDATAGDDSNITMNEDSGVRIGDASDAVTQDDSDGMTEDDSDATMKDDSQATSETSSDVMARVDPEAVTKGDSDAMTNQEPESTVAYDPGSTAAEDAPEVMADLPAWFSAELTDVKTRQTFSIADFKDQVVLVETMAIWCSNCLRQQKEVKALHEALGQRDGWVTVVLDVDPNEKPENLEDYTTRHGFDWVYAVAPRDVAREIGRLYGDQFLNPPSTPMLIIDHLGRAHPLPFGHKNVESLQEELESFLGEGA